MLGNFTESAQMLSKLPSAQKGLTLGASEVYMYLIILRGPRTVSSFAQLLFTVL